MTAKKRSQGGIHKEEPGNLPWTEKQVMLFEKLALLGQLLSSVAHEINSPIATAIGGIDNIKRNCEALYEASLVPGKLNLSGKDSKTLSRLLQTMTKNIETSPFLPPERERMEAASLSCRIRKKKLNDVDADSLVIIKSKLKDHYRDVIGLMVKYDEEGIRRFFSTWSKFLRNIRNVHSAARRVADTVGALQVYSHPGAALPEEVDLNRCIQNTVVILQGRFKKGIALETNLKADKKVLGNRSELSQVWMNLLLNAADSLAGKGTIKVDTFCRDKNVVVTVTDDGPGIPEENSFRLFEPFFTTKAEGEGTGLGLWISKQIVEKHKGKIEVESAPGKTTFTVTLPGAP